jgi:hypothetical protein
MTGQDRLAPRAPATVLRMKLALAMPPLRLAAAEVWRRAGLDRRYVTYLRSMHEVIRASVPLMELAAHRCHLLGPHDPVAMPLQRYFEAHIREEEGHDDWLLEDLAVADRAPSGPPSPPPPAVARLVGAQYYWVNHHHPVALVGYIAVLEGNAPHVGLADQIVRVAGVPEAAVRTVRAHAELDGGHTNALYALLETLALTPSQVDAVTVSALHTAASLASLFAQIAAVPADSAPSLTRSEHGGQTR